ncbi:nucleoside triphosphate pyrophosphohydrolase [Gammaproteobacteria bacterium]|nr:nucleoside triphosphate pyrophosphohydrolase [Gammaproteobacteria bacterium]
MSSVQSLLDTMQKLRDKDLGCPWDIEQTFQSLSKHLIEEAYEVTDAINRKDYPNLQEELGDVLLQVIFHSQIASELELFNFDEVADTLNQKLIRRHPHVFARGVAPESAEEQAVIWEAVKKEERKGDLPQPTFADIPSSMPPTLRAERIQKQASKKGFDWTSAHDVILKVEEEIAELKLAISNNDPDNIEEELGDLLFTVINVGRHLNIDANDALARANNKFISRFHSMEKEVATSQKRLEDTSLKELEKIWSKIKSNE